MKMRKYSIAPMFNFLSVQFRCEWGNSVFLNVKRHTQHKQKTLAFKEPYQIRGLTCSGPSTGSGSLLKKKHSSLLGSSSFLCPPNRSQRRIKRLFVNGRTERQKNFRAQRHVWKQRCPFPRSLLVWALNGADMMDN